mmetsp:Transcript_726/g.1985  ORF Transcript_726/g.1985 Transcript_726/m.1985 type:complete len:311 (+) Transcript_726:93-1025(+)
MGNRYAIHQTICLLVHAIHIQFCSVMQSPTHIILAPLLANGSSVSVQRQGRKSLRTFLHWHQNTPTNTIELITGHYISRDIDYLSIVNPFSCGSLCRNNRCTVLGWTMILFVVSIQCTMSNYSTIRKDQFAQRCDIQPKACNFSLVSIKDFLFVVSFFRHSFPSILISIIFDYYSAHVHIAIIVRILALRYFRFGKLIFGIFQLEIIKGVQFIPESLLISKFGVLFTNHVVLAPLPSRKHFFAIEAIMPEFDFFLTISQQPFQIDEGLSIRDEKSKIQSHIIHICFQRVRHLIVKQGLLGIDSRILLAFH